MEKNARILDLMKKMDSKKEIYTNEVHEDLNESVLKKYKDRFSTLILHRENNYMGSGSAPVVGAEQTVNSIVSYPDDSTQKKSYTNSGTKPYASSSLKPREAFEIAIKRTLESGNPINNISFYDEINWNLQTMGFDSKLPLDIKNALNDMFKYGEIKG